MCSGFPKILIYSGFAMNKLLVLSLLAFVLIALAGQFD
jgi:hypothetical protein